MIHLIPPQTQRRDHIRRRMRFGEHIFDLHAGFQIPFRHIMRPHSLFMFLCQQFGRLAFPNDFHDLERHAFIQSLMDQISHDIIPRADYFGNVTHPVADQLLGITGPYVGVMGQSRYLQQIRKRLRLAFHQHLPDKIGAQLRQRQRAGFHPQLLRRHAQRLRRMKQAHDLRIAHRHLHHRNTGVLFQIFVNARHIMSQNIQLQNGIVDGMEIKMGGDGI